MENTDNKIEPAKESSKEFQVVYDHLNDVLFFGELPTCMIMFQRVKGSYGYHSGNRWTNRDGEHKDEIALNPTYFATRPVKETLSTLAHEMCHLWQDHNGEPGRGRYHNKEWAAKMKTIGLQPYNVTNDKRETGDKVSHYIVDGGLFGHIIEKFLETGFTISWLDRMIEPVNKLIENNDVENDEIQTAIKIVQGSKENDNIHGLVKSSGGQRTKYTCPNYHYSVWGKKNINPMCGECKQYMIFQEESFTGETPIEKNSV